MGRTNGGASIDDKLSHGNSKNNSEIQTGEDVVSDKVPILRQTESTDDVKIFEGLKLSQRNQTQR